MGKIIMLTAAFISNIKEIGYKIFKNQQQKNKALQNIALTIGNMAKH